MRRTARVFVVISVLLMGAAAAFAGEATHRKNSIKLLELLNIDKGLDQAVESMVAAQVRQSPQMGLYEEELRTFYMKYLSWSSLKEDMAKLYMAEFSEKELKELIAFYETPTGRKAVKSQTNLTKMTMLMQQRRVKENSDELKAMLEAKTEKLKKLQESR